jgi:hypothetical protein
MNRVGPLALYTAPLVRSPVCYCQHGLPASHVSAADNCSPHDYHAAYGSSGLQSLTRSGWSCRASGCRRASGADRPAGSWRSTRPCRPARGSGTARSRRPARCEGGSGSSRTSWSKGRSRRARRAGTCRSTRKLARIRCGGGNVWLRSKRNDCLGDLQRGLRRPDLAGRKGPLHRLQRNCRNLPA